MKFQSSVVHRKRGTKTWFVISESNLPLNEGNMSKLEQEHPQCWRKSSTDASLDSYDDCIWNVLGYIAAELTVLMQPHGLLTAAYHAQRYRYHYLPTLQLLQCKFKLSYSTIFTFQFPWEISSTLRTVRRLEHQSTWNHQMPTGLIWSHIYCPAVHTEMLLQSDCISSQIASMNALMHDIGILQNECDLFPLLKNLCRDFPNYSPKLSR